MYHIAAKINVKISPRGDKRFSSISKFLFVVVTASLHTLDCCAHPAHTFTVCPQRKQRGSTMLLSPSHQLNSGRKSISSPSPSFMDKENSTEFSGSRRSNRRKSLDGLSPRSKGLSPQLSPHKNSRRKSIGLGSPVSLLKENPEELSGNRRSNRRKSVDGLSPRPKGLSPRVTPNSSNVLQVHTIYNPLPMSYVDAYVCAKCRRTSVVIMTTVCSLFIIICFDVSS